MQGVGRLGLGASLEAASNCKQNSCLSFQKRLTVDMSKKKQNNAMILWGAFARHDAANSAMSSHDVDHCDHTDCRVFSWRKNHNYTKFLPFPSLFFFPFPFPSSSFAPFSFPPLLFAFTSFSLLPAPFPFSLPPPFLSQNPATSGERC